MRYLRQTAGLVLGFILIGSLAGAQSSSQSNRLEGIGSPKVWTIAVLSPLNHVQNQKAYTETINCLERSLVSQGLTILSPTELRPTLRRYRIRSTGQVSIADAEVIQAYAKTEVILIPSIDFYYNSSENPEFGLSLRMVRPDQMRIIGAVSHSATGEDFKRLFGVGVIKDIDSLMARVVDDAIKQLIEQVNRLSLQEMTSSSTKKIAVIQYNNLSDMKRAGSIATNWTVSQLTERGYVVIEPGAVVEITSPYGELPVGGISRNKREAVAGRYDLDYIVTGQLDVIKLARGRSSVSTPKIEFGARLIEAETGKIVNTYHCEATGADGHIVFGMGKVRSGGALLKKHLNKMINEFKNTERLLTGTFDIK